MRGAEAVASGLFSRALPNDEVLDFTRATVARVAAGPTEAFLASKEIVAQLRDDRVGLWDSVAAENAAQAALGRTRDFAEGFLAFQQKRTPVFTGRS
jgi:enoyl-CoA hydratase/carnithine racemase